MGVAKDVTEDQLKKAYRKLALKWHPDRNQGSEEQKVKADKMFKDINEAYSVLSDPEKKRKYDSGFDMDMDTDMGSGGFSQNIDPNQIF